MNLRKLIFTNCDSYKAATKITPKGVMVHSTGANNPSLKRYVNPDDGLLGKNLYGNHWNRPKVGASVHAFIGKLKDGSIATYQVLPFNYKSFLSITSPVTVVKVPTAPTSPLRSARTT